MNEYIKINPVGGGAFIPTSEKGAINGVASLDGTGKVPVAELPSSVMEYQGAWDASLNSPLLADGSGNNGDVYRVSVAGTQNLGSGDITFSIGDFAIYNGSIWQRSPAGAGGGANTALSNLAITSINGDLILQDGVRIYFDASKTSYLIFDIGNQVHVLQSGTFNGGILSGSVSDKYLALQSDPIGDATITLDGNTPQISLDLAGMSATLTTTDFTVAISAIPTIIVSSLGLTLQSGAKLYTDIGQLSSLEFDTVNQTHILSSPVGNGGNLIGSDSYLGLGTDMTFSGPNISIDGSALSILSRISGSVLQTLDTTGFTLSDSIQSDYSVLAGNTRLLLWDVDNGTLARVSVGIANSGGVGYKVLRIPN